MSAKWGPQELEAKVKQALTENIHSHALNLQQLYTYFAFSNNKKERAEYLKQIRYVALQMAKCAEHTSPEVDKGIGNLIER